MAQAPETRGGGETSLALAEIQAGLAALARRVSALEDAGRSSQAATRQLGLDLATLGRALNDHIRAEPNQAHARSGTDGVFLRPRSKMKRRPNRAVLILVVALSLILVAAAIWAGRAGLGLATPRAPSAAPIVALGDTANAAVRPTPVESETQGEPGDRSGHALYGAGAEASGAPIPPGKP
jgi:hypothetical protein